MALAVLLHGCGGERRRRRSGHRTATERMSPIVRVVDPVTGQPLCEAAEVHFRHRHGQHPDCGAWSQAQTNNPNEISLSLRKSHQ
jgi:hypothetical protein